MSTLIKKRVHFYQEVNGEVTYDEDVDILTSADAVSFDDGTNLEDKLDDFAKKSDLGDIKGLSTTDKSSMVNAVNEVNTQIAEVLNDINVINARPDNAFYIITNNYSLIEGYAKSGFHIYLPVASTPITSNLEAIEDGYIVTEDGRVGISIN